MTLELGTTSLAQARLARGLTLDDAERSTRISRRFLIALEEHDYSVFPAPIYARGFLRTYCRYLGVNPEEQLAELPAGWATSAPASTQLPPVSPGPMTFNFAWLLAGVVIAAVIGLGIYLSQGGDNFQDLPVEGQQAQTDLPAANNATGSTGQASSQTAAEPTATTEVIGRALEPGLPGIMPDFEGVLVQDVISFLNQQGIAYLRIDATSAGTPAGLVMSQTPAAGVSADNIAQVVLTVSAGPTIGAARTDCSVLQSTNRRTAEEQAFFEANCGGGATTGDRTDCEEIRGTDYRSPKERTFFLTNCIIQ